MKENLFHRQVTCPNCLFRLTIVGTDPDAKFGVESAEGRVNGDVLNRLVEEAVKPWRTVLANLYEASHYHQPYDDPDTAYALEHAEDDARRMLGYEADPPDPYSAGVFNGAFETTDGWPPEGYPPPTYGGTTAVTSEDNDTR